MVRYNIDDVTEEMVLGESIFLPSGELLLAAGFHLTERFRMRLKQLGFHSVYIRIEGTEDIRAEQIISDHIQKELVLSINQTTKAVEDALKIRKEGIQNIRQMIKSNKQHLNRYLSSTGFAKTIENLVEQILNQPSIVLNMKALQGAGGDIFSHSVNVAVTALCIGRKHHFSYEEMKQLAMGALNYDLGLVALPKELLEKNGELTEEEKNTYRQHTVYGYLMLSQNPSIPPTSAAIALQHHEHQDGTGYPRHIYGENRPPIKDFSRKRVIHRFSEIVAVADIYDMLITGRMTDRIYPVQGAIKTIIEMGGQKLNREIVKTLVSIVPIFPVGARIRVLNAPSPQLIGYYGVVARDNPANLEEPQIVLYETRNHQRIKPILVDLSQYKGMSIELLA